MRRTVLFVMISWWAWAPGCAGTDDALRSSEDAPLVPADLAPELADDLGAPLVTASRGAVPLLIPDSVDEWAPEPGAGAAPTAAAAGAPTAALASSVVYDDGIFKYRGGPDGRRYSVVVSGRCRGYERDTMEASRFDGGGNCTLVRWYSRDVSDCRAIVQVSAPANVTGRCLWQVYANSRGYYSYQTANTDGARQNTVDATIPLVAGNTIEVGTCGLPNASALGDTSLRLAGPTAALVSMNDDSCELASYLVYTVPLGGDGKYTLHAGCFGFSPCAGTVAWQIR